MLLDKVFIYIGDISVNTSVYGYYNGATLKKVVDGPYSTNLRIRR